MAGPGHQSMGLYGAGRMPAMTLVSLFARVVLKMSVSASLAPSEVALISEPLGAKL